MSQITLDTAKKLGLLAEEFERVKEIMGRMPNFTELSIFSVMWSEHCSYKNSIRWLKTLPRENDKMLVGAGEENAGLVDIGDGMACAFKIESHNHPSAIEPYQGAATGVGGIHRDIFTMGARPIAALNSLRFGDITRPHTQHLMRGVVAGIGGYGNSFGVPTVGGETFFHSSYNQNILVNAMSVGIVKPDETVSAIAEGPGNPVFIVGSATGKDGIHGATFASADLTEDSAEDLPAVQVGDPFQEKLLLEASLEAIQTGAIVGMQDMGAAGITCSTSEMSAKGGVGMHIYLDKVPTRQADMKPFEILLSESQERMLIVAEKGKEHLLLEVFDKWDLECEEIGVVTDTGRLLFEIDGEIVADVPAEPLVLGGGAPVYEREYERPRYMQEIASFSNEQIEEPANLEEVAKKMVSSPNIASKSWISEQYDSMVRVNTMTTNEPADAALIRLKGTKKALAATTDCNPCFVYADPYIGGMIAVAEAARNLVCSGARPVAITNCLNFGNPYNKEVYYQFVHAVKGMGDACRRFDTPVTGGNVSFYNQTSHPDGSNVPVLPTPTIGMLGLLQDIDKRMSLNFKAAEDEIYLIGEVTDSLGSSEYLRHIHGVEQSAVPYFDLEAEAQMQESILHLIEQGHIQSAHDVSDGGLFITLLESAMPNMLGFSITTDEEIRKDAFLFGEGQGRVVVSVNATQKAAFLDYMAEEDLPCRLLGSVNKDNMLRIDGQGFGALTEYKKLYQGQMEQIMEA